MGDLTAAFARKALRGREDCSSRSADDAAKSLGGSRPFRLKEYVAGQRLVLERNPYYWKTDAKGNRLPYLDELVFLFVPSADAQVLRFQSGETGVISRLGAENFSVLSRDQKD